MDEEVGFTRRINSEKGNMAILIQNCFYTVGKKECVGCGTLTYQIVTVAVPGITNTRDFRCCDDCLTAGGREMLETEFHSVRTIENAVNNQTTSL